MTVIFKPTLFFGRPDENIATFLENFECLSVANNWSAAEKFRILKGCFRDSALQIFKSLPNLFTSFEEIRDAMLDSYHPHAAREAAFTQLMSRRQSTEQSVSAFAYSLKQLVQQAYPDPSEHDSKLLRYFMHGLNDDLRRPILRKNFTNFGEALTEALNEECLQKFYPVQSVTTDRDTVKNS